MKNLLKIIFFNLFFLILIFFSFEFITFNSLKKIYYNAHSIDQVFDEKAHFHYEYSPKKIVLLGDDLKLLFKGKYIYHGRIPDGLKYKNKQPIVIFGCSFAFGSLLKEHQTISYKLSEYLKRPVYNRALPGSSPANMLYQTENEIFYKEVPKADTVIYVYMDDHYKRLMLDRYLILDNYKLLNYHKHKNHLIINNYQNPLYNFITSTYIYQLLNHVIVDFVIDKELLSDKIADDTLLFFLQTRDNLEKNWNNKIKFIVLYYNYFDWQRKTSLKLMEKLKENNFDVINTKELTNCKLNQKDYLAEDNIHPGEKAWDLLIPLIVKEAHIE